MSDHRRAPREQRVFDPAVIRRDGLFGLVAGALVPSVCLAVALLVHWLFGGHGLVAALAGLVTGLGLLAVCYDYLAMGPSNARMRRQLVEKLRRVGDLAFDPASPEVYYVGLAYRDGRSSQFESDDDIGFIQVLPDKLIYRGDRLAFELDLQDLADVSTEPVGAGLPSAVGRVRLETVSGEPFEWLALSSREGSRLSAANAVTKALYEAVHSRWQRRALKRMQQSYDTSSRLSEHSVEVVGGAPDAGHDAS